MNMNLNATPLLSLPRYAPVEGTRVIRRAAYDEAMSMTSAEQRSHHLNAHTMHVVSSRLHNGRIVVDAIDAARKRHAVSLDELRTGLRAHNMVQHVSVYSAQPSLGIGRIIDLRTLGGREQALVELDEHLERRWLPCEHLRVALDLKSLIIRQGARPANEQAELLRLRALANAILHWHQNTGALAQLDIDPLPHQIHLVHNLIRSGHLNWIIADDVGLGKTIEVGLLLNALLSKRPNSRILIITPPTLVTQWRDELSRCFGIDGFVEYSEHFKPENEAHWRQNPLVIGSMDRLKRASHLAQLEKSGVWDLIVVDEAHRLTRRQLGGRYYTSERFKLAASLRERTEDLLLLTATPHQGDTSLFQALLELIRPELRDAILQLEEHPAMLDDLMYRNRKVDVTDAEGNFIFKGQDTHAIELPTTKAQRAFDEALQRYFSDATNTSTHTRQPTLMAIGFVVTVMRKLAASSHAAILRALKRRRQRIAPAGGLDKLKALLNEAEDARLIDAEIAEQWVERIEPFFSDEIIQLDALIKQAEALNSADTKLKAFMSEIVDKLDADRRLLIFTEFRGTQDHIVAALRARFGDEAVCQINGEMSMEDRLVAQRAFRSTARFMVSTEAGGEGLNLQERCHTLVNYDLPWNPMRLVQRLGRVYRYGQRERVQVFNMYSSATVDERVLSLIYQRLETVAREMSGLGEEFDRDRLKVEIFGELADLIDVEALLEEGELRQEKRSEERVAEAIERARKARELQQDLLSGARGFDARAMEDQLAITHEHVWGFVKAMLPMVGAQIVQELSTRRAMDVQLSDELAQRLGLGRRRTLRVASRREDAHSDADEVLTMRSALLKLLLHEATCYEFGGHSAHVRGLDGSLLVCAKLRWCGDRGQIDASQVEREEVVCVRVDRAGVAHRNEAQVSRWLMTPARSGCAESSLSQREDQWRAAERELERALAHGCNERLQPAQRLALCAAQLD